MANILMGKEVAEALRKRARAAAENLPAAPTLLILRVGSREDDIAYEQSVLRSAKDGLISVVTQALPADVTQEELEQTLRQANAASGIHGILLLRPLPKHLDAARANALISPDKDIDGATDLSLSGVFTGSHRGFSPCTAQAVLELIHHYDIPVRGKKVAVIGRSLVIGRPLGMLLMEEDATVVMCHRKTPDTAAIARQADILVAAAGEKRIVTASYVHPSQTVIDVGTNWDAEQNRLCGDVDFDAVSPVVSAITPVPGGIGTVTSAVLLLHVAEAAKRLQG